MIFFSPLSGEYMQNAKCKFMFYCIDAFIVRSPRMSHTTQKKENQTKENAKIRQIN